MTLVREHRPDVVRMDVRTPLLDGVAATERILADTALEGVRVLMLTFDLDEYVFGALRAGAERFPAEGHATSRPAGRDPGRREG